ncbi:hypothetical protein [uncultured Aquimarina sp.]|uniref:hypothetical protein n=1 Tax=uncultured Aquimarina sp. TaxID=575652 RepID=UPI002622FFAA|nr:hypothetical protein [uncultured Aquimarina sp.]
MNEFEFITDEGFFIWNSCTVFHGYVKSGEIQTNDKIKLDSKDGIINAKVKLMITLSNREIINKSIQSEKIAIGIDRFEKQDLNIFWNKYDPDVDEIAPKMEEILKIEYPLVITKSDS